MKTSKSAPPTPPSASSRWRQHLLAWYRRTARDLPWRRTTDIYAIWLSEIMLQQTQVDTVKEYYRRFLEACPDVFRLAAAPEDQILKLWEGLGYYSRARNLHRAAKMIVTEYGGVFPGTAAAWQQLPGIGRYTAGAIASIALHEAVPVLDGNVKRVLARVFGVSRSIDLPDTIAELWRMAEAWVYSRAPGDYNQALMELGARICRPRQPLCQDCPVRTDCAACLQGRQQELPVRTRRKATSHYVVVAAVIKHKGRFLIGKRPAQGMLGGLWEFPGGKVEKGETDPEAVEREVREELGVEIRVRDFIISVDHAYTHFSITLKAYACELVAGKPQTLFHTDLRWIHKREFAKYPLPKVDGKIVEKLF